MIVESIKSFEKLRNFHPGFDKVHDFIKANDLTSLPAGLFEIEERRIYGEIFQVEEEELKNEPLEVHDAYIEIYIVLEGDITFGYRDRIMCDEKDLSYDEIGDVAYVGSDPAVYLLTAPMNLIICFPKDAHNIVLVEERVKYLKLRVKV